MTTTHTTKALYSAAGYRSVRADSAQEAAGAFATRTARRTYGRGGYCRTLRRNSGTIDGSSVTYEAFVGRDAVGGGTTGHNIWVTVAREEE